VVVRAKTPTSNQHRQHAFGAQNKREKATAAFSLPLSLSLSLSLSVSLAVNLRSSCCPSSALAIKLAREDGYDPCPGNGQCIAYKIFCRSQKKKKIQTEPDRCRESERMRGA